MYFCVVLSTKKQATVFLENSKKFDREMIKKALKAYYIKLIKTCYVYSVLS